MSRINKEMTEELDDLDILMQRRMTKTTDGRGRITSTVVIDNNGRSHGVKEQMMPTPHRDDTARHRQMY